MQLKAGELPPRRPILMNLQNEQGRQLDQVMATFFPAPRSYTGEDVVEVSCHGSPVLCRQLLELFMRAGARLAEPGEFTLRAFLNGKMDLSQAEGVRDLIESQTGFQARVALEQLQGRLSRELEPIKQELVRIISQMETTLEFVEDDIEPELRERLLESLFRVDADLARLEDSFQVGRVVQQGLRVAIVGKPNTGKSSLFNSLVQTQRAIVTEIPGTTRDAVTETFSLEGVPIRLADTAGIRESGDPVERLGVEKSLDFLGQADLILYVVDRSRTFDSEDRRIWELIRQGSYLVVRNKSDLNGVARIPREVEAGSEGGVTVSALHGDGLEELKAAILQSFMPADRWDEERVMITDIRHKRCLERARQWLARGIESYSGGLSEEFPLYDFKRALGGVGEITGDVTVEDILDQIFATFCIGK